MRQQPLSEKERAQLQEEGMGGLVQGFNVIIEAFFAKPTVGELHVNPFAEMDKSAQLAIVQQAFIVSLSQSIAVTSKLVGVTKHEMMQKVLGALKTYVLAYSEKVEEDLESAKATVGKGSKAGDAGSGIISGS